MGGFVGGDGTEASSERSAESEAASGTIGILTNFKVSFLILISAFSVLVGSLD